MRLGDHLLGEGVFVIAEAGVNHNGSIDLARELVDEAAQAGADAIKFQTFVTEDLVSRDAPLCEYQEEGVEGSPNSQYEMLKRLELSLEQFRELKERCDRRGILFLSTPHTRGEVVEFLDPLVPAFKVGSGDLTNWPFLAEVARKGKPVILGTGMATLAEVEGAVRVLEESGNSQVVLLHCTTSYPCALEEVNLRAMVSMMASFPYPVGYSDHTEGTQVALMAVTLGACVVEKHFTLDKELPGPDHRASADPEELRALVDACKRVETVLGAPEKKPTASELRNLPRIRKSLYYGTDLAAGTRLRPDHLVALRPAVGISPARLDELAGRTLKVAVKRHQRVELGHFE
ncbi:MAG: N-acetylneuraminate synthase [Promethearchaeota archaeon]